MHALITGATGFLGKALAGALADGGNMTITAIHSRNCDLTDSSALAQFPHPRYALIFHLAAWTQAGDFCLHHPGEQWIINQRINTNVLAWWHERQPQAKLVAIGTSCSYDERLPLVESNYLAGEPTPSLFTYAMTKRMMYAGMLALAKQYGHRYLHVVPNTLYGPGYHIDGRQMHFIFDVIRKVLRGKHLGEPVVLWGDGFQRRELVYIDDFVGIMLRLVERCDQEHVNIGPGEDCTIRDFARRICDRVGYDFDQVQFDPARYVGVRSKCLVTEKLHRLLPGARFTPLDQGLERSIAWMEKRLDDVLKT
ncbi:MAG: NAD-dependent epimerase/dehydratase family protein [Pirellulaceae bacterium]|jgi:GDP-L-fucose synthase|nr:NAD-dependent epimerase/dehydratase family protein [Pirellulaceae bacterium]